MNSPDADWLDAWRLKVIATSVSAELKVRFGVEEFYSQEQVNAACGARGVHDWSRACAVAMFIEPGVSQALLEGYGISDPVAELRRIMAMKIIYSDCVGVDTYSGPISFHEISNHSSGFNHHDGGTGVGGDACGDSNSGQAD